MDRRQALAIAATVPGVRYSHLGSIDFASFPVHSVDAWFEHGVSRGVAKVLVQRFREVNDDPLREGNIKTVVIGDHDYPVGLTNLYAPPIVLHFRGQLPREAGVAVVGTRRATTYGRQAVEMIVPLLVAAKRTVVSGLALGIDTFAHSSTLRCGGATVAVMGRGLDAIYPRGNALLAERIVEGGGALVSEYAAGTPPLPHHFPARNRIISALSTMCVVVEGDMGSGALITAEHALELGLDVLAVPGSIFSPQSRGANHLIAQGATPLIDPDTLNRALGVTWNPKPAVATEFTPEQSLVLMALEIEPLTIDDICLRTGFPVAVTASAVTALEVSGAIERLVGGTYLRLQ